MAALGTMLACSEQLVRSFSLASLLVSVNYFPDKMQFDKWGVQPVCMPSNCKDQRLCQPGEWLVSTGLGKLYPDADIYPSGLQQVYIKLWNRTECDTINNLTPGQFFNMALFCGSFWKLGGIDTCQGDSGGPAVCFKGGHFVLQGVVSSGPGCGEPNLAGFYTNVCQIMDWIKKETNHSVFYI